MVVLVALGSFCGLVCLFVVLVACLFAKPVSLQGLGSVDMPWPELRKLGSEEPLYTHGLAPG